MWQDVWPALGLSLKVAFWATFLNLLLGIAVGFLLARRNFPGRDLLDTALTLPMVPAAYCTRLLPAGFVRP